MTIICAERMTARIDGEVAVFLIGMRINAASPASGRFDSAGGRVREGKASRSSKGRSARISYART